MVTELKTDGNYFIVTETGQKAKPYPKKSIYYVLEKDVLYFYIGTTRVADNRGYPIGLTGTVNLTGGASGSVDGVLVDGNEIMTASVPFNTSLAQTAIDAAANITANSAVSGYSAIAVGTLIVIKHEGRLLVDGFTVVSSATTITTVDVAMGLETGNLVDSNSDEFVGITGLETFLRANTATP